MKQIGSVMKKLLLLPLLLVGSSVWALPQPKKSCQVEDLQARYARLYAAGSTCGKDENSIYAKKLSQLFQADQTRCRVTGEQINPTDDQIDQAFNELDQLPSPQIKQLCSTLDDQIKILD